MSPERPLCETVHARRSPAHFEVTAPNCEALGEMATVFRALTCHLHLASTCRRATNAALEGSAPHVAVRVLMQAKGGD